MEQTLIGTNLELFGSDLEKKVKEAAAGKEEAWQNVNMNESGLYIWKVESFRLKPVLPGNYGTFYEGDSYVVLSVSGNSNDTLNYTVHFWLGNQTSLDEMGTAAYKTVELDTFLHGKALQVRETQGNESDLFRSYFPQGILYKLGGVESGFHKVEAYDYSNYSPLLFRVHNNSVNQVPLTVNSLSDDDVFVLDNGLSVFIYSGNTSSPKERLLALYTAQHLKDCRKNCLINEVTKDNKDSQEVFLSLVSKHVNDYHVNQLYKVQEQDQGNTEVTLCQGPVTVESFDSNDTFIFSTPQTTFVWIGKNSSYNELLKAWTVAIRVSNVTTSITLVREGSEPEVFKMCL